MAIISACYQRQQCTEAKQLLGGKLSLRDYNAYAMIKALNSFLQGLSMPETQYIGLKIKLDGAGMPSLWIKQQSLDWMSLQQETLLQAIYSVGFDS